MSYAERATVVPGAVLWERVSDSRPETIRILPDGCMDLIWDGRRLFVAGPDSRARRIRNPAGASYVGLRFSGGAGPALLGVPANEVRDQSPDLDSLWPSGAARELAERVAADPARALQVWVVERAGSRTVDQLGPRVLAMAEVGTPVAAMAHQVGVSSRQLHRRCLPVFGYGPRRLGRVLRLGRALDAARTGEPLAQLASGCGYVDQAHFSREVRELVGTTPTALLRELHLR